MDDLTTFERQIADELRREIGPIPRFDLATIARTAMTATSRSRWSAITRRSRGMELTTPEKGGFAMFSAVKFIAAGTVVALFGGLLLAGALGPREPEPVPAAPAASAAPPVIVTGTASCTRLEEGEDTVLYGLESTRGSSGECVMEMSDPRVSGTSRSMGSGDCPPDGSSCLDWSTTVIEGPEGGWDCSSIAMEPPPEHDTSLGYGICVGTGGYEGSTYVSQVWQRYGEPAFISGYIYEGPPPLRIVPTGG